MREASGVQGVRFYARNPKAKFESSFNKDINEYLIV